MAKNFIIISVVVLVIFVLLFSIAFAQVIYKPQIPIPGTVFEGKQIEVTGATLAKYIQALFIWGTRVIAILAVIMIMVAGFNWMTAMGNPSKISQAKDQISSALMGLILVLGANFLLSFINPALVHLKTLDIVTIAPIYLKSLCKDLPDKPPGELAGTAGAGGREIYSCGKVYEFKQKVTDPVTKEEKEVPQQCYGDFCEKKDDKQFCDLSVDSGKCLTAEEYCGKAKPYNCEKVDKEINSEKYVCRKDFSKEGMTWTYYCAWRDLLKCLSPFSKRVDCNEGTDVCWKDNKPMGNCRNEAERPRAAQIIDAICCKNETNNTYQLRNKMPL